MSIRYCHDFVGILYYIFVMHISVGTQFVFTDDRAGTAKVISIHRAHVKPVEL